ncbi:branched-chain alpha-keto acid dehydrogenase E1 component [Roseovarius marisflavi]|uniref:2-oxoglutarate dehydrogenase E1 component n=1 Tax=Roseovarius marisflavi TaxID=1054996 RepID=A0A1M6VGJ1_9RHOB|nr:alpha-ketoacid dehydrogenase subunit alpha/beta [Roseovarius marisflavi]SHK80612.1 branched-chain alpha-keto acid dehydrogenase E1 component [Roseovarius marisflavi]
MDRAEIVHENFLKRVGAGDLPALSALTARQAGLDHAALLTLFRAQVISRQLDRVARRLQAEGQGFYTIGSSGHEGVAAVASALRPTDPAFLHYRDGAFQVARAQQVPGEDPIWDMLLSFTASADDPISGGRHKVLGSKALSIPPQTSTIASHLPKAVGAAYSIGLMRRSPPPAPEYAPDAIAFCSFGDASMNHSTAQGALNCAGWTSWQGAPLPLLFLCEDNGIGISVKSPEGWVSAVLQSRPGLRYFSCNGLDPAETYATAREAADWVRRMRKPAVLHMSCVRLYGHAGPDVEAAYRPMAEIEAGEAHDPLLYTAARLIAEGCATKTDILELYQSVFDETSSKGQEAIKRPKLSSAADVMASIIPPKRELARVNGPDPEARAASFGPSDMRALEAPQPMNKLINLGLSDLMLHYPEIVMAGEDIGRKGGVYGITKGLQSRFGAHRMIDSLLDEQSILGLSLGLAQNGYIPMPEIQFLAYLHNAEDQLRGEAATLSFFSNGQFTNPMVLRIAGLGYQKGFGGHFHNDNSLAVLRDIPGIVIGCPSNGYDAVLMYREAVRLAREEARVVVMVEPIALYPMRDLNTPGDGGWMRAYPGPDASAPLGQVGITGTGTELAIVTYGNGCYLSHQAMAELGEGVRVIDLRWIAPLAEEALFTAVEGCDRILIVDECRRTGGQAEALAALFGERLDVPVAREVAEDSFIATGPAYGVTMPSKASIIAAAERMLRK